MKNLLTFLLLLVVEILFSQNAVLLSENFDSISDMKKIPSISVSGATALISEGCGKTTSLLLANNGSIEITLNTQLGIGEVSLDYKIQNISSSNGYTILYSYSNNGGTWTPINSSPIIGNTAVCFPSNFSIKDLKEIKINKFRIEIKDYRSGELIIDNLKISELSQYEFTDISTKQDLVKEGKKIEEEILKNLQQAELSKLQESANHLKDLYYNKITTISNVYNYVGHIDISTQMYSVFNERNEMANPMAYDEFSTWVTELNKFSDLAQKNYIKDLEEAFKKQRSQYKVEGVGGNTKIGKAIGIVADVGNILTGGKLNSIINSFKGIFSNVFSKSNIEAQNSPYSPVALSKVEVEGEGKQRVVLYKKDPAIENSNSTLITDAGAKYLKFSGFFSIIEEEYSLLDNQSNDWKATREAMQLIMSDSRMILKEHIGLIDKKLSEDDIFIEKILDNDTLAMKQMSEKIELYFANLIEKEKNKMKQTKDNAQKRNFDIEQSSFESPINNIKRIGELLKRYQNASLSFKSLFTGLKLSLEARENPWTKWMIDNKDLQAFSKAEAHWNKKRTTLVSELLPTIIKSIEDTYVKVNLEIVEPIWRNKK